MVAGGRMVLTILGRESDDPSSRECCYIWKLLALALNEMVSQVNDDGYYVAKCMRVVAQSLLASHFGGAIIDELFRKFEKIVGDRMAKEKTQFFNVTISVMKN
ncbi:nicotinamide N-methyltransferase [Sarracenia purpurea var. burkii]